jgi:hypothetical protein
MRLFYHNQCIYLALFAMVSSCGLQYTPPETPEAFEQRRHKAVESYVQNNTKSQGLTYESVAFGETEMIKPSSYRILDSLYTIKYKNELKGLRTDNAIEEQIGNQRIIARNDTNRVLYIENHVFALSSDTTTEIYAADFQVSSDAVVNDMIIRESTFLPKRDTERYKQYLFNESFLNQGSSPGTAEQKFYALFTTHFSELSKDERDKEVRHMLHIMEIAQRRASLGPEGILKALAAIEILGKLTVSELVNTTSKFTTSNFQYLKGSTDPASEFLGYTFVLKIEPSQGNQTSTGYSFEYDRYFHLVRKEKLY